VIPSALSGCRRAIGGTLELRDATANACERHSLTQVAAIVPRDITADSPHLAVARRLLNGSAEQPVMNKLGALLCVFALTCFAACGSSDAKGANEPVGALTTSTSDRAAESTPGTPSPVTTTPSSGPASFGAAMASSSSESASAAPPSGAPTPPAIGTSASPPLPGGGADGATRPAQAGTLTAGAWDDNRNFDRFMAYRAKQKNTQRPGILPLTDEEHASAHEAFSGERAARKTLDVSLVIDTTGSMGDEITYLQTEFLALSRAIESKYPDAAQRWSLVVYRDKGDEYVARWFDFYDDADAFRDTLAKQYAAGGGDFEEAPDAALNAMQQLDWREGEDVSRLVFWVADAPHHNENASAMAEALRDARNLDVHIYPVASSGIDEFTELSMRSAAQFTGGRYLFLTNDSGVGGDHKEPSIPCYFVTRLDQAILRMVQIELSGAYAEPSEDQIVRRSGNVEAGACKLESGDTVEVF
jgi:hypothetical protein